MLRRAVQTTMVTTILFLLAGLAGGQEAPIATVEQGSMRGATLTSRLGRKFYAFRSIPYAAPPVGSLRFQAPVAAGPWEGELDATKDGPECMQRNFLLPVVKTTGQEDCLFLNVYTPKVSPPFGLLPVMVYIHGGGWFSGSGASYILGPEHFMDRDVLLVSLNYRLGALGFLSTGDSVAPGNNALKDQVEALSWVKDNIAAFGGDPNCVTLFGQSAGAASVHYHMLSPLSAGLFHRAITQSGTALNAWAWPLDPKPIARSQAELMGCPTHTSEALISCLQAVDGVALTDSADNFHFWSVDPLVTFRPVVEHGPAAFLQDDPYALVYMGAFANVPWMNGVVGQEGILRAVPIMANTTLLSELNSRYNELMPRLLELEFSVSPELISYVWRNISNFYFGDNELLGESNHQKFIDLYSDRSMLQGFHKAALLHSHTGSSPQYLYHFNYRGLYTYASLFAPTTRDYGVCHCDELIYLFNSTPALFPGWSAGHPDLQVIDNLITLWTNFAKHGNPTPAPAKEGERSTGFYETYRRPQQACGSIEDIRWEPHVPVENSDRYSLRYLDITAGNGSSTLQFCMKTGLHNDRLNFWTSLPIRENNESSLYSYLLPFYYMVGLLF